MLRENQHLPTGQVLADLGERIRDQRIRLGYSQVELAALANIAPRSLQTLESGQNSTTQTLVRVLKALGSVEDLRAVAPLPSVSPMAALRRTKRAQRVGGTRTKKRDL